MALTTINRPIGRRFAAGAKTATVDNNFNYARFTSVGHGLSDGDLILIQNSPVPAYNGIWYVSVTNSDVYFINPSATADYVSWVADATVNVRSEDLEHMWSCVQLPIVYEVTNSIFPYNTATPLSIISIDNDNGFARLRLSGDFPSTSIYPLEFIRILNASDARLNGIWQAQKVTFISTQAYVTIDLAYSGTYVQSGSQVTKYYSNYALIVQVYAGITNTPGAVKKPMQLAATLKFIPDNNNTVRFSISDILKSFVKLRNGVGDDTMPNNIDFFTEFYVTYQETYDYSFGYTLLRYYGSTTNDNPDYVGKAVNAKLDFGNPYSGYLSDYLMNTSTAKFLTLFAIPVLFACQDSETPCYQDISFINPSGGGVLQKKFYKDGVLQTTVNEEIPVKGPGVYRMPLRTDSVNMCLYDQVGIQLTPTAETPEFDQNPPVYNEVKDIGGNSWGQAVPEFIFSNTPAADASPFGNIHYWPLSMPKGVYTLSFDASRANPSTPGGASRFYVVGLDASLNVVQEQEFSTWSTPTELAFGNQHKTGSFDWIITEDIEYIGVWYHMDFPAPSSGTDHRIYALEITDYVPVGISEEKIFRIDCGCSNQEIKLTWVNNLGGFDYWTFKAEKDYITEVTATQESNKNVLPQWPQSYGHTADTLRYETERISRRQIIVRSQNGLTRDEAFALGYIKSSPLVQIIDSKGRRTVTVDTGSLRITGDGDKLREIEFTITETGDIPAQNA